MLRQATNHSKTCQSAIRPIFYVWSCFFLCSLFSSFTLATPLSSFPITWLAQSFALNKPLSPEIKEKAANLANPQTKSFKKSLESSMAHSEWQPLLPGLEYMRFHSSDSNSSWSAIHAFRLDLQTYYLELKTATELSQPRASIKDFFSKTKPLLAINGGFFDSNYQPLGLRINSQQQLSSLKKISWWSVFYIKNKKAYITTLKQFNPRQQVDFAVQAGPRLIIDKHIPSLKAGEAERSALGITEEGKLLLVVTEHAPVSTTTLAKLMRHSLNAVNAINLDGGHSSQLQAKMSAFKLYIHGFSNLSDAILVFPRDKNLSME